MKIAFIEPLKIFGGQERFCLMLAKSLHNKGDNVIFITDKNTPLLENLEKNLPKSSIKYIPFDSPFSFQSIFLINSIIKKEKIDISFFNGDRSGFFGKLIARIHRKHTKFILCVHLDFDDTMTVLNKIQKHIYKLAFKLWLNAYDMVIPVNKNLTTFLIRYGITQEKIHPISNGMLETLPTRSIEEIRNEFQVNDHEKIIGFVGRLEPQKGISCLIQAIDGLKHENISFRLIIFGQGSLEDAIQEQVKQLNLEKYIIFAGYRHDIHNYYQMFDLIALPSQFEGFPLTVIEAMSHACCIVATQIPGNTLALEHQRNALLVPPDNSSMLLQQISLALKSETLRKRLAKQAKQDFIDNFEWESVVRNYSETFKKLTLDSTISSRV